MADWLIAAILIGSGLWAIALAALRSGMKADTLDQRIYETLVRERAQQNGHIPAPDHDREEQRWTTKD